MNGLRKDNNLNGSPLETGEGQHGQHYTKY